MRSVIDSHNQVPDHRAVEILVGFASALREAGVAVSPGRTRAFLQAVSLVELGQYRATYWAGRATLCSNGEDTAIYDKVFQGWFSAVPPSPRHRRPAPRRVPQAVLTTEAGPVGAASDRTLAVRASDAESLRHRDLATLSDAERAALAGLFDSLDVRAALRRSVRRRKHRRGSVDLQQTLRLQLQGLGEVNRLRFRDRGQRPRRIVLMVDISGSMQPYADSLLRLSHRISTGWPGDVEVFTLGTRLTRVTSAMATRNPEDALLHAGQLVPDWSGGTRLGEMVRAFNRRWGRRGLARGAVVVIASDGWERGDPQLLGDQTKQLRLLCHALIWLNPHVGKAGYAPIQGGMKASLPSLDHLVAGHSMVAFAELLEVMADA